MAGSEVVDFDFPVQKLQLLDENVQQILTFILVNKETIT